MALPASSQASPCKPILDKPAKGQKAIEQAGDDLELAAQRSGISEEMLADTLSDDRSAWLNRCGRLFFQEPLPARGKSKIASSPVRSAALLPQSQTFSLHSKPGSSKVLYLNFRGYSTPMVDLRWSSSTTGYIIPPFTIDSDSSRFSSEEHKAIQLTWRTVAEDFAPFDIDVTTQPPPNDALIRSSSSDTNYGVSIGFTARMPWSPECNCGGRALFAAFGWRNEPATPSGWVVTSGSGLSPYSMGMVASHEAGHTFKMTHWGFSYNGNTQSYNPGLGPFWGPIMGNPYGKPITHWSDGDFAYSHFHSASHNDNIRAISEAGVPTRSDDFSDSISSAFDLGSGLFSKSGLIGTRSDVDWFQFQLNSAQEVDLVALTDDYNPNLDLELSLYDSSGQPIGLSQPDICATYTNRNCGTTGYINSYLSPGTYYVKVDGVGYGPPGDLASYSDYGSLGNYRLIRSAPIGLSNTALPMVTARAGFQIALNPSGLLSDLAAPKVTPLSDSTYSMPSWMSVRQDSAGLYSLVGNPPSPGQFPVKLVVEDSLGRRTVKSYTLEVSATPPPVISAAPLPRATRLKPYRAVITASSPERSFTFSLAGLPPGLSADPRSGSDPLVIQGKPQLAQSSELLVTATTPSGRSATVRLTLVVDPLPLPSFSATSLPQGVVGQPYPGNLGMRTGAGSTRASLSAGWLPRGISLRPNGLLVGTPTQAGSSQATFVATDAFGQQTLSPLLTITVVVQEPQLASSYVSVARNGRIPVTMTCAMRGGCSPGGQTLTLSQSGRSVSAPLPWPALPYRASRTTYLSLPALAAAPGSIVSLRLP